MAFDPRKLTIKASEAIQRAQELAEMLDKLVAADKLEIVDNNYTIKQ